MFKAILLVPVLLIFSLFFFFLVIEPVFIPDMVCLNDGNAWNSVTERCIDTYSGEEYKIRIIQRTH